VTSPEPRESVSALSTHCSALTTQPTPCTLFLSDAKMQHTLKKVKAEVKAEYKVEL